MTKIHEYFRRDINRTIEKVIDYYAQEEDRLAREVAEYEITDNIESCFRKFLDVFGEGVRGGQVTEVGIWVSGFYGSGKSSFTKYLGASLDPTRTVGGKPFLDLLCDRFPRNEIPAALRTVSKKHPTDGGAARSRCRTARRKRRRPGLHRALLEGAAMGGFFQGEEDRAT